jgi:methionyl-tRNA formyltransferase
MNILFAGTPDFAVPALEAIVTRHSVVGVLTQADAPQGRGRATAPSSVKTRSLALGLSVFEPDVINRDVIDRMAGLTPDLLVCVAYGKIFRQPFLDLFPRGGVNIHPSLLPRFRGPSPIQAAILAGDSETGVTVQRLALAMDSGAILAQQRLPLGPAATAASLAPVLAGIGAELCAAVVDHIAAGTEQAREQDHDAATYCKLITKDSGLVDFASGAAAIDRLIRAYTPWPLAFAYWNGKRVFFHSGGVYPGPWTTPAPAADAISANAGPVIAMAAPGTVLGMDKQYGILIHTGNGILYVNTIQLEFKKPMPFRDFLNGHRDFTGSVLGR